MRPEFIGKIVKVTRFLEPNRFPDVEEETVEIKPGEEVILSVSPHPLVPPEGWGFTSIEVENLLKASEEFLPESALVGVPANVRKKPYIERLAFNEDNDGEGHKKHAKIYEKLVDNPVFAAELDKKGIDKAKLKQKFKDKQK